MVDAALAHLRGADVIAILTRAPSAGGKSRLFAELARPSDPRLLEALLLDTLDGVRGSRAHPVLFVTPATGVEEMRALVPGVPVLAQGEGSLGDRMHHAMSRLIERGALRVAVVGSDLPTLSSSVLDEAFGALEHDAGRLVLGPTHDGGYYLVAATSAPSVFDGIAWGSAQVLAQTVRAAATAGWPIFLLATLDDVDTPAGLERAARGGAPRTGAWVRAHLGR